MSFSSEKIKSLPPYLFSNFAEKKKKLEKKGINVIDLGIGSPDLPPPDFITNILAEEAKKPGNHRYSSYKGSLEFREAVAGYYRNRYSVDLDPEREVLALIGSKEGIAHFVQAVINPGDTVLVPDPGYPVYRTSVHLAGGESVPIPLDPYNNYVPAFHLLPREAGKNAKLMFLNYPNNPTTAVADLQMLEKAVKFAKENQIFIAHDHAYDLVTFGNVKSPSILQVPGAKEAAIEFGSLSKSFNMAGWRIGFAAGNKELIQSLMILKSNMDTSQFLPIQKSAAAALASDFSHVKENNRILSERMERLYKIFTDFGLRIQKPRGTIFLWAEVPEGFTSLSFTDYLLERAGIIVTPGTAFGTRGEGYIRISMTAGFEKIAEIEGRLRNLGSPRSEDDEEAKDDRRRSDGPLF